jgi:hypothetical protein
MTIKQRKPGRIKQHTVQCNFLMRPQDKALLDDALAFLNKDATSSTPKVKLSSFIRRSAVANAQTLLGKRIAP